MAGKIELETPAAAVSGMSRDSEPPPTPAHPAISEAAFHGLAGDIIGKIAPHTEADPAGLLVQTLATFGNLIGRSAHFVAGGSRHYANLFLVVVGKSSIGRKGTSLAHVTNLFTATDSQWTRDCRASGLSSGEGLIFAVRDLVEAAKRNKAGEIETFIADSGVSDKRLLVVESEFAQPLRLMKRDGNILSVTIRQAWDSGDLRTLTKASPVRATGAHVSIIGHITLAELTRELTETDTLNGFANRFLWPCVQRKRCLPDGDNLASLDLRAEGEALLRAVDFAKECEEMERDEAARARWHEVYPRLTADIPGLLGSVLARAAAQTVRLSMIFALLDCSRVIRHEHLDAALALWDFCEQSARFIFGEGLGDSNADRILAALRASPDGMTRTEISENVFGRNVAAKEISRCLNLLAPAGVAFAREVETGGRSAERWLAVGAGTKAN